MPKLNVPRSTSLFIQRQMHRQSIGDCFKYCSAELAVCEGGRLGADSIRGCSRRRSDTISKSSITLAEPRLITSLETLVLNSYNPGRSLVVESSGSKAAGFRGLPVENDRFNAKTKNAAKRRKENTVVTPILAQDKT